MHLLISALMSALYLKSLGEKTGGDKAGASGPENLAEPRLLTYCPSQAPGETTDVRKRSATETFRLGPRGRGPERGRGSSSRGALALSVSAGVRWCPSRPVGPLCPTADDYLAERRRELVSGCWPSAPVCHTVVLDRHKGCSHFSGPFSSPLHFPDFVGFGTAWRLDLHNVPLVLADQRARDRRSY